MASKGHFCREKLNHEMLESLVTFTHIPQPMHSDSDMVAILSCGVTSIHSFPTDATRLFFFDSVVSYYSPILLTGQDLRHSCRHFLGLQRSTLTIATRVNFSSSLFLERDIFPLAFTLAVCVHVERSGVHGSIRSGRE